MRRSTTIRMAMVVVTLLASGCDATANEADAPASSVVGSADSTQRSEPSPSPPVSTSAVTTTAAAATTQAAATSTTAASLDDVARSVADPLVVEAAGGRGVPGGGLRYDPTPFGYVEHEYFFEGTAHTFQPSGDPQPYRSRMIVWTPADPTRFTGTTVVEWAHVSDFGMFELTVELAFQSPMLERRGDAFVLVSAEEGGICDVGPDGCSAMSLRAADPERYGTLSHPGDAYSFDIFNQAMKAIRAPVSIAPLGSLRTTTLIAEGFQASVDKWFPTGAPDPSIFASPFTIYGSLNAYLAVGADEAAHLADGFLIDGAAPLMEPTYRVPTLHHLDESAIRRVPSADTMNHITWEVVGAGHTDRWTADHFRLPSSTAALLTRADEEARRDEDDDFGFHPDDGGALCTPGRDTGTAFPRRFTLDAALAAVVAWARDGQRPPAFDRIERTEVAPAQPYEKLARDDDGVARGGLRSPIVEVPVAFYNGEGCVETGTMRTLSPEEIAARYSSHGNYVEQLRSAVQQAVTDGQLTCDDAATVLRLAAESTIGGRDRVSPVPIEC